MLFLADSHVSVKSVLVWEGCPSKGKNLFTIVDLTLRINFGVAFYQMVTWEIECPPLEKPRASKPTRDGMEDASTKSWKFAPVIVMGGRTTFISWT